MVTESLGKKLHDKSTRGELLTVAEVEQLEEWYARADSAESKALGLNGAQQSLSALQSQIDTALSRLMTVTKRIQQVAADNDTVRREIADLRHQVAHLLAQAA